MKKIPILIPVFLILMLVTASCGRVQTASEQDGSVPVETPEPTPSPPETEEELRQAIARAGDGEEALEAKRGFYEQLLAMDAFQEADYTALAQVYADMGEEALQRDILSRVLRLYPSREYAQQLSAIVVRENGENEEAAALAQRVMDALGRGDASALLELTAGEEWKRIAQGGMMGIETRTRYCQGEDVLQIVADGARTEITWQGSNGRFCFYQGDETGTVLGETVLIEGGYSGAVTVACRDGEGNLIRACSGTLADGVCVDQIAIEYQGVTYTGKLNADGTTAEEQYQKVAEAGGVVYAYAGDGKSYLFREDTAPEDFRMDAAWLGLPEYTEWR